ncbi:hypothetical protein PAMH27_1136 [Pseudomonas aeruginosa MH27]|nr:hypothetical protein PAMH27_1136 [Pseudomonas aeruginosa MH27]
MGGASCGWTYNPRLCPARNTPMPKHMLSPQGDYAPAGLVRRLAAMFYDFLLCVALMMVVTLVYQQGILRLIYGSEHLRELADRGALIGDPLLSTLLVFALFGFFAKFWTHNGQTLGMQVWGLRVQNRDGSAISLLQALLRFMIAIASWLCLGLGFLWMLWDKDKRTWHDRYSESQVVRLPKNTHKK